MRIKSGPCQFRNIFSNLGFVDRKINILSHYGNARSHIGSSRINSRGIFHQRKRFQKKLFLVLKITKNNYKAFHSALQIILQII